MEDKILISISGKSGAGKSIFSMHLANFLNAELLSLDKISHMSLEDNEIKNKLLNIFGTEIFDENNVIIRKKLGVIVFSDKEKLEKLNTISQKFMEDYIDNKIKNSKNQYIILEYALLTKMKYFNQSEFKILISASEKTRLSRLSERDKVSEEYLKNREKNLPDFNNNDFDFIIENDIDFEHKLLEFAENTAKKIQTSINRIS